MIGFDFGGPVNKTALIFGTAVWTDTVAKYGIEGANFVPGTAAQAAISVAPLVSSWRRNCLPNAFLRPKKSLPTLHSAWVSWGLLKVRSRLRRPTRCKLSPPVWQALPLQVVWLAIWT